MTSPALAVAPDEADLPRSFEAEQAVLGSLLLDRDAIVEVSAILRSEDFAFEAHATLYRVMLDLYEQRRPVEPVTVLEEVARRDLLQRAGGRGYAISLVEMVPTALHVEHYARIVERLAVLRRLIAVGAQIMGMAREPGIEADEAIGQAEAALLAVAQRRTTSGFEPMPDILARILERLDYVHENRGAITGVPTGFIDLDKILGGLQRSDLVILGARPAQGKSGLALGICHNAAVRYKQRVGFFSLEMSKEQLVQRLLCMQGRIDGGRLRSGYIDEDEWTRLIEAAAVLSQSKIFIDDSSGINTGEMRNRARRLQAEQGLDLVVVDYLQLMQGRATENRVQEISGISRALKVLARELNIPVLALSQVSRAVDSRTSHVPMLSDLRESGCLTGDTLVYLPDIGKYRPIAELAGQSGFTVLGVNIETWRLERATVARAFSTGVKPVFRLTTRLGRVLRATANHRFLTVGGWQRLDELVLGTHIALPRRLSGPEAGTMNMTELALLGHLIGDGCTLPRHAIQYTTRERALAELVADLAFQVFGDAVAPRISQERGWYQVYLAAGTKLTHGKRNPVSAWLDGLGVFGLRSHEKRVPDAVFAQPAAGVARFLKHLWATDGCIHLSSGPRAIPRIFYASSSEVLARNVQSLLLRLDITARLRRQPQAGKGRDQYLVVITGQPDVARFVECIGALGASKVQHQTSIVARTTMQRANTNRDVLPPETWRSIIVPAARAAKVSTRQMQAGLGVAFCGSTLYKSNLSRARAARLAPVVASDQLALLATSDVYWDQIAAIEPAGEEAVYDLTVEGLHNFVAGDIIVHNSIEQDADVVVFLCREEMYDPETEKRHIADLYVAKHRNGPTGHLALYFDQQQTRFRDLETHQGQPL